MTAVWPNQAVKLSAVAIGQIVDDLIRAILDAVLAPRVAGMRGNCIDAISAI
jgi:hypothetical protein